MAAHRLADLGVAMIRSSDVAICTTAWKRPYYLKETLAAWERVRWIGQARRFQVSLEIGRAHV